jgi:hypothetical protein
MAADGDDAFALDTGTSVEALREARRESRAALDHRVRLLYEIDEQATRSVRTSVVTFGVLVSGVGVAGTTGYLHVSPVSVLLAVLGVLALFCSVFVGVGVVSISATDFGIDTPYRRDVRDGNYSERDWLLAVLRGYDEWDAELEAVNHRKESYLFVSQAFLLAALVLLAAAVGLSVMPH